MNKSNLIMNYLDEIIGEPHSELQYEKDYELLLAIVLSAQTTDKRVNQVTSILFDRYNTLEALSLANIDDIRSIIMPLGTSTVKAKYVKEASTILLYDYNGVVPKDKDLLVKLPGVGPKTANVFLIEYYNYPLMAVDTHVSRVSKRLGIAKELDNPYTIELKLNKFFPKEKLGRLHKQLVLFGRYHCKAIKPECDSCKLKDICRKKN